MEYIPEFYDLREQLLRYYGETLKKYELCIKINVPPFVLKKLEGLGHVYQVKKNDFIRVKSKE